MSADATFPIIDDMQIDRSNLADFTYFLSIARHRSFRRASLEVGVSASALSHAIKGLEERLGVRLLNRTNRNVTLTMAGEALRDALNEPFEAIGRAVDQLNAFRDNPTGRIRLNVLQDAVPLLLGPVMPTFVDRYPDVEIDLTVTNRMIDLVKEGFDAGIRYGGTVPQDMVAQRLSPDLQWVVAAAPDYLKRFGTPHHPTDLANHRCLRVRMGNDQIYRWEFTRGDEHLEIDAPGSITIDEATAAMSFGCGGVGLLFTTRAAIEPRLASGELKLVLEDWATMGPGFYIYYPSRRQVPNGLRLLTELIREMRPLGL
ncbi:LysR substrate-binding domain-containing protein [Afipia felis]